MIFDIFAVLYVMSAIVGYMFAIGAVIGIACMLLDKIWHFVVDKVTCNCRE